MLFAVGPSGTQTARWWPSTARCISSTLTFPVSPATATDGWHGHIPVHQADTDMLAARYTPGGITFQESETLSAGNELVTVDTGGLATPPGVRTAPPAADSDRVSRRFRELTGYGKLGLVRARSAAVRQLG